MKVDVLTFNQYATELHHRHIICNEDYARITRSLNAKGVGFIHDLTALAGDIRLALSTGLFKLSEHCNKVFERARRSVLPRFLLGALRRVFHDDGRLLGEFCLESASNLLMFCDALKRTDPPRSHVPSLEQELWSGLRSRFGNANSARTELISHLKQDPLFRGLFFKARDYFRAVLSKARLDDLVFATGPGKNLDRYEAFSSPAWYMPEKPTNFGPASRGIVEWVRRMSLRTPFQTRKRGRLYSTDVRNRGFMKKDKGDLPLKPMTSTMQCSAQPKSFKALRGVGVMHAGRMIAQLALQRSFYRDCLNLQLPLVDQSAMGTNLSENFWSIGTIDLSAASDLTYWHVLHAMGQGVPWFDAAYELRTKELHLPDGVIECVSPVMGEAITFPLLSAYLYAIAMSICDQEGWGHDLVRVYGDDVQTPHYCQTIEAFHKFGLRVSITKSYPPHSHFKESCEDHFVGRGLSIRQCRPAFIPSIRLNRRGKVSHKDAYRLLVLAKDCWVRNPILAKAACDVVEMKTSLVLPFTPYQSSALGRPTLTQTSHGYIEICSVEDRSAPLSERAALRKMLRVAGLDSPTSLKLAKKQEILMTTRTIAKLKVRNTLTELENAIMIRVGDLIHPDRMTELRNKLLSDNDLRSWVQQNCSEDDICAAITLLIEHVRVMELRR